VRRALAVLALALAAPAPAAAALTLAAQPEVPRYGATVTLSGKADPGDTVELFFDGSATGVAVSAGAGTGEFAFRFRATQPGSYRVEAGHESSPTVKLKIRPVLTRHLAGLPYPGNRLLLRGKLRPAGAGTLTLKIGTRSRRVRVHAGGRYAAALPTDRIGRHRLRLVLDAGPGYKSFTVRRHFRVQAPSLSLGSRGRAVLALERRLKALRHVLRGVDRSYRNDTYEAVLAFQKVHGMARTGRVSRSVWAALGRAHVPTARVAKGNHVEVSKTLQVMFEVRRGKVVHVVHVSTGATGNTPVGKWHVYSKVPGMNASGMYYSLFFTGAFAIHGYHSVPPYPASHGCVRTPLWFAPGFYARWAYGTTVYIFA
jgi:L,D-transpeptidase-like protein/putative peptidoglycan binding protein